MYDLANAEFAGSLNHVEGALDVGIDIGVREVIRVRDRDESGEVQNCVAPLHSLVNSVRVTDVSGEYLELASNVHSAAI